MQCPAQSRLLLSATDREHWRHVATTGIPILRRRRGYQPQSTRFVYWKRSPPQQGGYHIPYPYVTSVLDSRDGPVHSGRLRDTAPRAALTAVSRVTATKRVSSQDASSAR